MIRGIRGATTVEQDDGDEILAATVELLRAMQAANAIDPERIASIFFSMTPDLNAAFPAEAGRRIGWTLVPVICMRELSVPGALERAIRVMMLADVDLDQDQVQHCYLRRAVVLRRDLDPITDAAPLTGLTLDAGRDHAS